MNSDQIQHLEPIESAIGVTDDLFGFVPDRAKLISLCYIPLREIGNFYTRQQVVTTHTCEGEVKLPCKTFEISSVMASCDTGLYEMNGSYSEGNFLNNPHPVTEYVSKNPRVPWENIFDMQGNYIGYVENGLYYGRDRIPAGTAKTVDMRVQHASRGGLFSIPADYRVEGSCLKFWPANVDSQGHYAENGRFPVAGPGHSGTVQCASRPEIEVQVRYVTLIEDERGYPLVDEPTKTALAYYMNYTRQLARYFNQEVRQEVSSEAEQLYNRKVAQARSNLVVSENLKRKILNTLYSHNREGYQPGHISL